MHAIAKNRLAVVSFYRFLATLFHLFNATAPFFTVGKENKEDQESRLLMVMSSF